MSDHLETVLRQKLAELTTEEQRFVQLMASGGDPLGARRAYIESHELDAERVQWLGYPRIDELANRLYREPRIQRALLLHPRNQARLRQAEQAERTRREREAEIRKRDQADSKTPRKGAYLIVNTETNEILSLQKDESVIPSPPEGRLHVPVPDFERVHAFLTKATGDTRHFWHPETGTISEHFDPFCSYGFRVGKAKPQAQPGQPALGVDQFPVQRLNSLVAEAMRTPAQPSNRADKEKPEKPKE